MTFFLSLSFYVFKSLNASFSVSLRDPFKVFLSESLYLIMSPCSFLTLHLSFSLYVFSNDDALFTCPCHVSLLVYLFSFLPFSFSIRVPFKVTGTLFPPTPTHPSHIFTNAHFVSWPVSVLVLSPSLSLSISLSLSLSHSLSLIPLSKQIIILFPYTHTYSLSLSLSLSSSLSTAYPRKHTGKQFPMQTQALSLSNSFKVYVIHFCICSSTLTHFEAHTTFSTK